MNERVSSRNQKVKGQTLQGIVATIKTGLGSCGRSWVGKSHLLVTVQSDHSALATVLAIENSVEARLLVRQVMQ